MSTATAPGMLSAARWYAAHGWYVFPLHSVCEGRCSCGHADCGSPGKHPRTLNGLKDATADQDQVTRWWTQWSEANIGIATGADSGIVALDIDPRHGGDDTLVDLLQEHGALPATVESRTTSGGRHLLFQHPGFIVRNDNRGRALGVGIDVKGDGGYIVAPPSVGRGRPYAWAAGCKPSDRQPAELPEWIVARLRPQPEPVRAVPICSAATANADAYVRAAVDAEVQAVMAAGEGVRNDTLNDAAFSLGQFVPEHLSEADVEGALLPAALAVGLPEAEVRKTICSGIRAGREHPRQIPDRPQIRHQVASHTTGGAPTNGTASGASGSDCTPVLTCMADVVAKPVEWLWPGKIPLGCLTLVVGKPGEGKSYLACDAAARVSTGTPWPDGSECPCGSTILISAEDDPETILRPRLDAHYANVRRIHLLSAVRRADPSGKSLEVLFTLQDLDALEAALRQLSDVRLIVIDPIGSFLGARTDAHRDNEVRAVLAPVAQLAAKYGAAALVIAHRRKATGATADELAIGSRAFTGIARAVWHVSRDGQSERRLFLPGKMNVARRATGAAFNFVGDPVSYVSWERDPVNMTADQALAVEAEQGGGQGIRESCKEWLRDLLTSGPLSTERIKAEAKAAGFTAGTLRRAREEMAIRVFKLPGRMGGPWHWRLKAEGAHQADSDTSPETAPAEDAQEGAHHV